MTDMGFEKQNLPATPAAALDVLRALADARPPLDINDWLFLAETAEKHAFQTMDRGWADVVVSAHVRALVSQLVQVDGVAGPRMSQLHQVEEMTARTRMIKAFGVDPAIDALRISVIIDWLQSIFLDASLEDALRDSTELFRALPSERVTAGWLRRIRRIRLLKRVAKIARSLESIVALPRELAKWSEAADDL